MQYNFISNVSIQTDISCFPYWHQLKFINLFFSITGKTTKQIVIGLNDIEIQTVATNLEAILWILKYETLYNFEQIVEMVGIDNPGKENRFKIVIVVRSLFYNTTLTISFTSNEITTRVNSISYLYQSAGWLEREIWDMFGIKFNGNTDLRRILTDYGFSGHPLRKDFPLTGFREIYYDDSHKRILHEPVEMAQELRIFSFKYNGGIEK